MDVYSIRPTKPIRHKGFSDINEVRKFVCNSPFHPVFILLLTGKPHQLKMAEGWLGADLIFDLDGDHPVTDRISQE